MAHQPRKGLKRKHGEEEDDVYRRWQRQYIIDMSMGKLRTSSSRHGEPDPCLRRSVLILNTLKQIEAELKQEGVDTRQSMEAARNEIPEMSTTQLTLDPLPDMSTFIYPLPVSSPIPMSVEALPAEGGEANDYLAQDSSVVDLLPAKPVAGCQDHALSQASSSAYYRNPSQSLVVLPSSSDYYAAQSLVSDSVSQSSVIYYGTTSLNAPSSSTYYDVLSINSVLEPPKLFEDGDSNNNFTAQGPYGVSSSSFDQSMMDNLNVSEADLNRINELVQFDDLGLVSTSAELLPQILPVTTVASPFQTTVTSGTIPPSNASSSLSPPSSAALSSSKSLEEIAHYLLEASDTVPSHSHPFFSQASVMTTQCSTYCRCDSTLDDLDSIMQILVGM